MKKRTIALILLMLILIAAAALFHSHNQFLLLQGEVDAPEVMVTSKAKGRVIERHIERGDDVKKGQLLLTLESPELAAQYAASKAATEQARAKLALSINGTREETIRNLQASLAQVNSQYQNATREYSRLNNLSAKGYVSANELDSARKARDVAFQQVQGAQAQLEEAKNGDRIELRQQYEAALNEEEQKLAEIQVQLDDLQVRAPVDGEIGPIPAEVGEIFNAGSPLVTMIRLPESYFIYNLREDILVDVKKGDKVQLDVPALGDRKVEAVIRYIAPKGDYATKRATRATGDFDLKTFEVRMYPLEPIESLRPGMSVLWRWDK